MNYHYIDDQNKSLGPVSLEALQELIRAGGLKNDPMVVPVGGSEWQPLSTFAGQNAGGFTSNPSPAAVAASPQATREPNKAVLAVKDALTAFKLFGANPVAGAGRSL